MIRKVPHLSVATFEDIAPDFFTPYYDYNVDDYEERFCKENVFSDGDCRAALAILVDPRCTQDHIQLPVHVVSWCTQYDRAVSRQLESIIYGWDMRLLLNFIESTDSDTIRRLGPEIRALATDRIQAAIRFPWNVRLRNACQKLTTL